MKIEGLKSKFQFLSASRLAIPFFISLLIAFALYFFTQQFTLNIEDSDILYVKKGSIAAGIVHLSQTPGEAFSFFINLYITQKQGQHGSFTVLKDRINKISFLIGPDRIPVMQWKSKKLLPSRKARRGIARNRKVSRSRWNHVGFIYKDGILSTFVNGSKCWEILTKSKKMIRSHLEILPETDKMSTLKGKATYPVLLARALSLQHILDLQKSSRLYDHLAVKIFSLFLFGFLFGYFVLTRLFLPLISLRRPGFTTVYQVLRNVLFMFSLHFIFFLVFNLGYDAARYINIYFGKHELWNSSAYFTLLVIVASLFFLSLGLGKITGIPDRICMVYVCGVMWLLMFTVTLCILPRFNDIYPFVFNVLFSLLFSLVIAAPNILWMLHMAKVTDETGQAVQEA